MRFEPEHDPNPLRDKLKTIFSLSDIPEEQKSEINKLREHIIEMLRLEEESSDREALPSFLAFTQFQIHNIQQEILTLHNIVLTLAQHIDELREMGGEND